MTAQPPIDCGRVADWHEIPEAFVRHALARRDSRMHEMMYGAFNECYVEEVNDWSLERPRRVKVCYTCNIVWEPAPPEK